MNILVTGAKGMVGTALVNNLKNIRDGKNRNRPGIHIDEIFEYDLNSTAAELDEYCRKADFVFNLAGVNRPEDPEDFMRGNFGFASDLLNCLKKHSSKAGIMLSSSIQATLAGRFGNSEYGRSKKAGEEPCPPLLVDGLSGCMRLFQCFCHTGERPLEKCLDGKRPDDQGYCRFHKCREPHGGHAESGQRDQHCFHSKENSLADIAHSPGTVSCGQRAAQGAGLCAGQINISRHTGIHWGAAQHRIQLCGGMTAGIPLPVTQIQQISHCIRLRVRDELELCDEGGNVTDTLHFTVDIDSISGELRKRLTDVISAEKALKNAIDDKQYTEAYGSYGEAITGIFAICF